MREMSVFVIVALDEFGNDDCHLLAGELFIILLDQIGDEFAVVFLEDEIIEDEVIDRVVHLLSPILTYIP